jgi:hypothetical protein
VITAVAETLASSVPGCSVKKPVDLVTTVIVAIAETRIATTSKPATHVMFEVPIFFTLFMMVERLL